MKHLEDFETTISIVLRLPENISKVVLDAKNKTGVHYPEHKNSLPHITLYSSRFNENLYPKLLEDLTRIQFTSAYLTMSELLFTRQPKHGNLFVHFDVMEKSLLQSLHENVLSIANPLRGNLVRHRDLLKFNSGLMTKEDFLFIEKYGFLYFMEKYNPHITIGVIKEDDTETRQELTSLLGKLAGTKFSVDRIFVKMKKRSIPDYVEISQTETTEILLS